MGGRGHLFKYWLLYSLSLCFFLVPVISTISVYAQEADDEFVLEEITVTAEKREAELQKIPLDISVVRPDEMLRLNINQVADLDKILPDVQITTEAGSFVSIQIREVMVGMWNPTFETTVTMHLDGVQLTRVIGLDNQFYDLERVEVLKGPQGTLYGRGSTAGSMNIVTQKPILGDFGGNMEFEAGNFGLLRAQGAINIPIVDKLAIRFAGRRLVREGYSDSGYSDADSYSGRMSVRWEPSDRLTLTSTIDYEKFHDNGPSMFSGAYFDTYGNMKIIANPNATSKYQQGGPVHAFWESKWALGNNDDVLSQNWNDNDGWGLSALLEYDMDFANLTVQYGHRSVDENKSWVFGGAFLTVPTDPNTFQTLQRPPITEVWVGTMDPMVWVATITSGHMNSMEVRLTSKSSIVQGDNLEWIVGGLFVHDVATENAGAFYRYMLTGTTESSALFLQGSYSPWKRILLTGGFRQNWDDKRMLHHEFEAGEEYTSDLQERVSYNWSEPSYKANVSFIATPEAMFYLQYSRGYKTGNIDFSGRDIPPEFLDSYELGFKTRWFNNRLQVNGSAYYYEYENFNQWSNAYKCISDENGDHYCDDVASDPEGFFGGGPDYQINMWDYEYFKNVGIAPGGSVQRGISTNIIYLLTRQDTVTATASWSHNEWADDYDIAGAILKQEPDADNPYTEFPEDRAGREFGGAKLRGNIGYSHRFYIGRDMFSVFANAFYEGKGLDVHMRLGEPDHYKMPGRDDYWLFSMSAMYTSDRFLPPGMNWYLRLWCNNILGKKYLTSIRYTDEDAWRGDIFDIQSGYISGSYVTPRTYGVSLGMSF